jgi:hypothetical protein
MFRKWVLFYSAIIFFYGIYWVFLSNGSKLCSLWRRNLLLNYIKFKLQRETHNFTNSIVMKDQNFIVKFSSKVIKTSSHIRGNSVSYVVSFLLLSVEAIILMSCSCNLNCKKPYVPALKPITKFAGYITCLNCVKKGKEVIRWPVERIRSLHWGHCSSRADTTHIAY